MKGGLTAGIPYAPCRPTETWPAPSAAPDAHYGGTMMPRTALDVLLVADDLTGACDAAAPFAAAGIRATVMLALEADVGETRVLAVTTDSRGLPADEIRGAMSAAAALLPAIPAQVVFKKIDSTLRGNTAVEIAAALETFGCRAAVVCPAFPAMHRVVRQGYLHVATAADFGPVHVPTHLSSAHRAACELRAAVSGGDRMVSLDAECDADLDRIAAEIAALEGPILWAGSAGLAAALARSLNPGSYRAPKPARAGPVLFCIGSDHAVTLAQQAALLSARNTVPLECPAAAISQALVRGQHVLLRIPRDPQAGASLCEWLPRAPAAALVLSGGDTASLVCRALGVTSIALCDEIVSGIPRGVLQGGALDGMPVVTKSGGFGNCDALIEIADYFSCPHR
ncbi:MAG TPA: four-carbon acid sugar kinase family protein [Bryobacteraceae bacterium]|nr:four-carbon acid sugar kinase family protein [Bryobacteraceae bacterium]